MSKGYDRWVRWNKAHPGLHAARKKAKEALARANGVLTGANAKVLTPKVLTGANAKVLTPPPDFEREITEEAKVLTPVLTPENSCSYSIEYKEEKKTWRQLVADATGNSPIVKGRDGYEDRDFRWEAFCYAAKANGFDLEGVLNKQEDIVSLWDAAKKNQKKANLEVSRKVFQGIANRVFAKPMTTPTAPKTNKRRYPTVAEFAAGIEGDEDGMVSDD
jgi:hypothetical protein